jgi:hypothetical protein
MPNDTSATHQTCEDAFQIDQDRAINRFSDHDSMPLDVSPAFQARTASDWIASAAIPEFIGHICHKGLHLKAIQHLVAVLDFAQRSGVTDAGLYEAIEMASSRAVYRGKENPPQPLSILAPAAALSRLRGMLVLVLGDDFNLKHPDYERLKQRSSEARQRRIALGGAKPSNSYATAQGRRDAIAADDFSDPDDPPF